MTEPIHQKGGDTFLEDWTSGPLADYVEPPEYGYTDSATSEKLGPRFLRITDIQEGDVDWSTVPYCSCRPDALRVKRLVSNDIVVARIGGTTGKSFFIESCPGPTVFASYLIRIRPSSRKLASKYLYYYMQSDMYWSHIDQHKGDRLKGGVNIPVLSSLQIAFPPRNQQDHIVRLLDQAQAALHSEESQHRMAAELKRAVTRELFTRGLRGEAQKQTEIGPIPESWNVVPLGSLGRVGNGSTPKRSIPAYWNGGTYPWLTSAKVYDREIVSADQFVTDTALDHCHLPRIKPGAVLIAITGQGKTLGHCAVLRFEATINQHIAYVAVDPTVADPSFVRGYLETQYEYLRQVGSGGGSTKGALTCAFLRDFPIPQTDPKDQLREQREIVAILDALDKKVDLHKRKRGVLEDLFKSLLHKLMTGEIRVSELVVSALGHRMSEVSA